MVRGRGFDVLSWVSLGWGVLSIVVRGGVGGGPGCLVLDWSGDFGINPVILRYFWDFPKKMIFL